MEIDPKHGSIERLSNGQHVVRVIGKSHLANLEGVTCENPEDPEDQRIYSKVFRHKRIYLPDEADKAQKDVLFLHKADTIVLGMTGYSSIKPADCAAWGVKPGAYERACEEIMANMVYSIRDEYPNVTICIADGASDMGVDQAVINTARRLGIPHLGHSCPQYMMYVVDDEDPVLVSANQEEYSDAFIQNLHILCSVGGRLQALMHDIKAAIVWNKKVILFDLVKTISANRGGPPARSADGAVQDATAAFLDAIRLYQLDGERVNPYDTLREWVKVETTRVVRQLVSPEVAFSKWKRQI